MKQRFALISVLLIMVLGLQSAEIRNARFLYFGAYSDAPDSAVMYVNGQEPREVSFPRNNFSKAIPLKGGRLILHFLPEQVTAGEEFPKNAPSVEVPETWEEILVFASRAQDNPVLPMSFHVINASDSNLRAGDRMFINFTDNSVFGFVGSEKLKLNPKAIVTIRNPARAGESYQVKLDRFDPGTKQKRTFIRQVWKQSSTKKSLIFIYSPPGSKRITYYNAPVRDL